MKNIFGLMATLGFVVFSAAGCGSDGTTGNSAGYQSRDQGGTGKECSQQLVSDAQALGQAATNVQNNMTLDGLNQLKAQVQAFKTKYDGVVCTATDRTTGKAITFDATAESNKLLDAINKAIQTLNGGGANPGGLNNGLQDDFQENRFADAFSGLDLI